MMTKDEALKTLTQYNAWRRDIKDINQYEMPTPTKIGAAIDVAIEALAQPSVAELNDKLTTDEKVSIKRQINDAFNEGFEKGKAMSLVASIPPNFIRLESIDNFAPQPAQNDIIEEQRKTIKALNMCIGGKDSTTTENITRISRLEAEIERLKQPAQEPYGWIYNECIDDTDHAIGYYYTEAFSYSEVDGGIPIYTHPAPSWQGNKEFVGLSDDEITNLEADHDIKTSHDTWEFDVYGFAHAIEAKLKEKNNG